MPRNPISNVVEKANKVLGFLKRNLQIGSAQIKGNAYIDLVRPQTEYCSTVEPTQFITSKKSNLDQQDGY